jgi:hypothetical protein
MDTILLEQALASALLHAANWTLSSAEQDRLREGCLTRECGEASKGNILVGF